MAADSRHRTFLELVRSTDIDVLQQFVRNNRDLNVDCSDSRGQRALDIAVDLQDELLVEALLTLCDFGAVHIYGALLRAVSDDQREATVALLLDAFEKRKKADAMVGDLPEFETTPLMAAATQGNTDLIELFLKRGYTVEKPHHPKCVCSRVQCERRITDGETLFESITRINAYRALVSPEYIVLTSDDPFLTTFQLNRELKKLSEVLSEHKNKYKELAERAANLQEDLLNHCHSTAEVKTVLVQRRGSPDPRLQEFSRLRLAVHLGQTKFVAHPVCQQVLRNLWIRGLPEWNAWSVRRKVSHVLVNGLLTPFFCLAYLFVPTPATLRPVSVPLNRFIYSTSSYLVFLCLLFATVASGEKHEQLTDQQTGVQVAIGMWVVAHVWELVLDVVVLGPKAFLKAFWPCYDLLLFAAFLVAEFIWFLVVTCNLMDFNHQRSRSDWVWYHPFLIAEGIFSAATIMAFSRVLIWYQTHSRLGPLGTSLRYMLGDVFRFLLIVFVFLFAFSIGINSIYMNYDGNSMFFENTSRVKTQPQQFVTLKNTFKTLFWGAIGEGGDNSIADIILNKNATESDRPKHYYTEFLGYALWAAYHIATAMVLMHMLVAMMAETYKRIHSNSDMEWKFARASLWLSFLDKQNVVPPPYNLLPSIHGVVWLVKTLRENAKHKKFIGTFKSLCCYVESDSDREKQKRDEYEYKLLMGRLVRRYLQSRAEERHRRESIPPEIVRRVKAEVVSSIRRYSSLKNGIVV